MIPFRLLLLSAALSSVAVRAEDAAAPAATPTPVAPAETPKAEIIAPTPAKKPVSEKDREITPAEIDALIARLSQIRGGLDAETRRAQLEALKALNVAVTDNTKAVSLFIECTRAVEFDKQDKDKPDKTDKTAQDFDAWRKQNDDKLHDPGFAAALRMQYRYLKLCLESDTPEKAEAALPAILALQEEAIKVLASSGSYASVLKDDVTGDVVSRRFGVAKLHPEGWPGGALDLDGQFRRVIKKALETGPESIPSIWETRLKYERAQAEAIDKNALSTKRKKANQQAGQTNGRRGNTAGGGRSHGPTPASADTDAGGDDTKSVNDFENIRLPRLLWAMSEDFLKAGLHRRGFESMFTVIMKYPKHPDVSDWVDRITELAEAMKSGDDTSSVESKVKGPGSVDTSGARGATRRSRR